MGVRAPRMSLPRSSRYWSRRGYSSMSGFEDLKTASWGRARLHSYEEFTRLAETRLAQNRLNYLEIA